MSPGDFGDVMLSLWPGLVTLIGILVLALIVIRAIALAGRVIRNQRRRERDLPALSRAIGEATRAMDLGGLVIHPETERYAAHKANAPTEAIDRCGFCHDLAEMGDPEACCCGKPCGAKWCTALRRQANTLGDQR